MNWGYGRENSLLRTQVSATNSEITRLRGATRPCDEQAFRQNAHDALNLATQIHQLLQRAAQRFHAQVISWLWSEFVPHQEQLEFERRFRVSTKRVRDAILACLPVGERDEQAMGKYDAALTFGVIKAIAQDLERLGRK